MKYPTCKKIPFSEEYFGHTLEDPYRWLSEAKNPEVLDWVARENALTDSWFDGKDLQERIEKLKSEKLVLPFDMISPWGEGYGATRMEEGSYNVYRLDKNMKEERLVMGKDTMQGYAPFQISACPSNERYLVISGNYEGDARFTPLLVDCEEKRIVRKFEDVFYTEWSESIPAVYYPATEADVEKQESRICVRRYNVETETDERLLVCDGIVGQIYASSEKQRIILEIMKDYTLSYFYTLDEETGEITDITCGTAFPMKYVDSLGGNHYFISKADNSLGELLKVPDKGTLAQAKTVLSSKSATLCDGFVVGGSLFLLRTQNACYQLVRVGDGELFPVELPGEFGTVAIAGRRKEKVFLKYESFTDAPMLLAFDGRELETVYRSREKEYPDIVVEQKWAASLEDGKKVPYFLVHRKDAAADGQNPTWIYGYGGYNYPIYPWSADMVTALDIAEWVDSGGIYVLTNIRGGGEFGATWHEEGMLNKKKNCYFDFIAIVEQLHREGWTSPARTAICGCSNGGLLMSALVTMRPELFGCVIDSVPHTDMIHFAEDDRGPMYITEYGNPKESRKMFEYLLSYSPYHNVKAAKYPSVYIQTGECDNNVPPYHGKKFAARMQEMNTGDNPILLRVLEKGAHDRGRGEAYWQTIAEMHVFAEHIICR